MATITIVDRFGKELFTVEATDQRDAIQKLVAEDAYLEGANLEDAYLRGANLRGAYLEDAYLRGANLRGANLRGAYLEGANLRGAYLRGAYLEGAYLRGAKINWSSHDLLAEILRLDASDDVDKRKFAGLVLISRDWCWKNFIALNDPLNDWALDVLSTYVQDDDNAPAILRQRKTTKETVE